MTPRPSRVAVVLLDAQMVARPPKLNTFTCFPDLPPEIRSEIWSLAESSVLNEPQVLLFELTRGDVDNPQPWNPRDRRSSKIWHFVLLKPRSQLRRAYRNIYAMRLICREADDHVLRKLPDKFAIKGGIVRFKAARDVVMFDYNMGPMKLDLANRGDFENPARRAYVKTDLGEARLSPRQGPAWVGNVAQRVALRCKWQTDGKLGSWFRLFSQFKVVKQVLCFQPGKPIDIADWPIGGAQLFQTTCIDSRRVSQSRSNNDNGQRRWLTMW